MFDPAIGTRYSWAHGWSSGAALTHSYLLAGPRARGGPWRRPQPAQIVGGQAAEMPMTSMTSTGANGFRSRAKRLDVFSPITDNQYPVRSRSISPVDAYQRRRLWRIQPESGHQTLPCITTPYCATSPTHTSGTLWKIMTSCKCCCHIFCDTEVPCADHVVSSLPHLSQTITPHSARDQERVVSGCLKRCRGCPAISCMVDSSGLRGRQGVDNPPRDAVQQTPWLI